MKSNRFKNSTLLVLVVTAVAGCAEPLAVLKQKPARYVPAAPKSYDY